MSVLIHDALLKPSRPKKSGSQRNRKRARAKAKFRKAPDARARKKDFNLHLWNRARGPPPFTWGGPCARARARARARALSTRDFQNSHFLLYNFQNNQGKSCLASRVWQLCKISAQSEPISMSYDRNNFRFLNPNSFL